jgi:predicted ATP-grasp superfamily ATP-dependent carboligase
MEETKKETIYEDELIILPQVLSLLRKIHPNAMPKVISAISAYFEVEDKEQQIITTDIVKKGDFSEDRTLSPKEFILQKNPQNDVERVACLAYYLTYYRKQPKFKTLDISKLNTEAAQLKFSNPSFAVVNAINGGYIVSVNKNGTKQISAFGEKFVQALPDRDAARNIMKSTKSRRKTRKKTVKNKSS